MLDYAYHTVPSQCDVFIYYLGATGAAVVAGVVEELLPQLLVPVAGAVLTAVPPCVGVRDQTGRPP